MILDTSQFKSELINQLTELKDAGFLVRFLSKTKGSTGTNDSEVITLSFVTSSSVAGGNYSNGGQTINHILVAEVLATNWDDDPMSINNAQIVLRKKLHNYYIGDKYCLNWVSWQRAPDIDTSRFRAEVLFSFTTQEKP